MTHVELSEYFINKNKEIKQWSDDELVLFHSLVHLSFSRGKKVKDIHSLVYNEMMSRKLGHSVFDKLDEVTIKCQN